MKLSILLSLAVLAATPAAAESGRLEGRTLVLEPGQTAVVAIQPKGPVLVEASRLSETDHRPSGDVLGFEFESSDSGTTLMIRNGYDRAVDVDAEIYAANGRHQRTSMCVVIPRGMGHELWPHPIARIEITKFKFVDMSEMRCD